MQAFMDCRAATATRQYTLRFGFNAFAAFEAEAGRSAFQVIGELEAGALSMASDLRLLCWSALLQHHPDATPDEAGHLLDADPGCVHRALALAMPLAEAGEGPSGKKPMARLRTLARLCGRGWKQAFPKVASGT